jgi:hypothetical protein
MRAFGELCLVPSEFFVVVLPNLADYYRSNVTVASATLNPDRFCNPVVHRFKTSNGTQHGTRSLLPTVSNCSKSVLSR